MREWRMRFMAILLLSLAFAGCVDSSQPEGGDQPLSEQGETDPCASERIGVVLWTGDYQAGPDAPFTVAVDVPECARNVRYEISTAAAGNPKEAHVELTGCGSDTADFGGSGNAQVGASNGDNGELCAGATAGDQTFTVEATLGALSGTVTLRADLPPA